MGLVSLFFLLKFLSSMAKGFQQPYFVENVGIVDENLASTTSNQIKSSSVSNVENVHLEFRNVTLLDVVNVSQLAVVEA